MRLVSDYSRDRHEFLKKLVDESREWHLLALDRANSDVERLTTEVAWHERSLRRFFVFDPKFDPKLDLSCAKETQYHLNKSMEFLNHVADLLETHVTVTFIFNDDETEKLFKTTRR